MVSWYSYISEKYKYFAWTPERTGSNHFVNIISKLGFQTVTIDNSGYMISYDDKVKHNHFCRFFNNHWDYKFILTVRNPYAMMVSRTGIASNPQDDDEQKEVEWKIENALEQRFDKHQCCDCFQVRKPDYFIRLENLYEDWLKIPFIKNTDLYWNGELETLCKIRVNNQVTGTENPNYWKKFYNKRLADLVYYNFPHHFELFGYDIDSWKS